MRPDFFCPHDLIQARYETLRLVKHGQASVATAVASFGFRSRSSYYRFAKLFREQGLGGLFDLRPFPQRLCEAKQAGANACRQGGDYPDLRRPAAAVWGRPGAPWRNAFHGLWHKHHRLFVQMVRAFAEGNGVRGLSRIFDIDKNTVLNYLRRAACQCRRITDLFIQNLRVEEVQLDEMWSFVYKKEKHLSEEEYLSQLRGDQWCWVAFDARSKVVVQYEIGRRTYSLARELLRHFRQRTDGAIPALITSDEYEGYPVALLEVYGSADDSGGKVPPPEMDYAVISKTREKGRIVDIKVRVVFGNLDRIETKIQASPVSQDVNVAFVERSHLSRRQFNRRLTRKTLGFSKKLENHRWHYELETAIYHFVRPHRSLNNQTPMMAAGKTDHPWSVEELLAYTQQGSVSQT